tara:strand:- start:251 stop:1144 length:894 start_codon:yes stop_codon:yes gene_type:complete
MSISRQNLSVVIVTFNSDKVIYNCVQSIPDDIKIFIVDNSNDKKFKENIEKKYNNIECVLSSENLGMGSGNNLGLRHIKTDYAIILNPDVVLEKDTIQEIINESKHISNFAILAPLSIDPKYPNYKLSNKSNNEFNNHTPFKVKSVDGFAMVLNLKKINLIENFKNFNYFDENFFMYLENDDLCKRLIENNENIFVIPKSKIKHLGARGVNPEHAHEVELSRNWHWIWSKFYFNKKHKGYLYAFFTGIPYFLSATLKFILYLILNNRKKKKIYLQRISGFLTAVMGKKSYYRPKIKN